MDFQPYSTSQSTIKCHIWILYLQFLEIVFGLEMTKSSPLSSERKNKRECEHKMLRNSEERVPRQWENRTNEKWELGVRSDTQMGRERIWFVL